MLFLPDMNNNDRIQVRIRIWQKGSFPFRFGSPTLDLGSRIPDACR